MSRSSGFAGSSRQAYLAERQKRREEAQAEDRAVRPLAPPEECCSEEDIRDRKPRILLTNYRQLEVLTTRLPDVQLFAEAPLKYLVFDEAHTYAGATGAEVACLVRRLRALAGKKPDEITCIGTSATLSDPAKKDKDNDETARRFASRFFGVDAEQGDAGRRILCQPGVAEAALPAGRSRTATAWTGWGGCWMPSPSRCNVAVDQGRGRGTDRPNLRAGRELAGVAVRSPGHERVRLPEHANPQAAEAAGRGGVADLATGGDGSAARRRPGECRTAGLSGAGSGGPEERRIAAAAQGPLLPAGPGRDGRGPRRHRQGAQRSKLFLSLAEAKEQHAGRHDDAFFPVLTCRSCGQHFFEKWYKELEFAKGPKNQLKDFDHGNATQDDDGSDNAVWSTSPPPKPALGWSLTNRLLEEADGGPTTKSPRGRGHGSAASAGRCTGARRHAAWPMAAATRSRCCR